jgi:Uridine kinase
MAKMVEIICENIHSKKIYAPGITLMEIASDQKITLEHPIIGAMVNNRVQELDYQVFNPKIISFFDITHPAGMRMYLRSLFFVLEKAIRDLLPGKRLSVEHSVSKGFYCEIEGFEGSIPLSLTFTIGDRMREIISRDVPFTSEKKQTIEVLDYYKNQGYTEKVMLLETRPHLYTTVYFLDDRMDYFYGCMVPSTGYLKKFDLVKYYDGMLLMVPKRSNPSEMEDLILQDKMFDIFREYRRWIDIIGVSSIGSINKRVLAGKGDELIKVGEALHEKKVAQIADEIYKRRENVKVVLISGPSSSGKTTFAKRLAIQLLVSGLKPVTISLDNYFVDREHTPRDENGDYDFESVEALDIEYFNQDLLNLLSGIEINVPKFSFENGKRYFDGTTLKIDEKTVLLIEGIHALTPFLTHSIPDERKFKVYVSALTSLSIDGHNRIPTTDNRLIRRIIRDFRYRGYSALDTISRWESVRRGEDKNIFPYQEEADMMFNSSLVFELGVLKRYAEPLLREVPSTVKEFAEADRLLTFLENFVPIDDKEIPPTSIIREFLGGSSFSYK